MADMEVQTTSPLAVRTTCPTSSLSRLTCLTDNPNVINSIGLPEFAMPGPPVGQPLLNDDENTNLNNFFSGFDSNSMQDKQGQQQQYQMHRPQGDMWNMPPTFVGSETTIGPLDGIHPAELERTMMSYENGLGTRVPGLHVHPASHVPYQGGSHGLQDNWSQALFHQLSTAASGIQPGYSGGWQHQQLQPHGLPLQHPGRGPPIRFGSDSHFQPSGFTGPPINIPETQLENLDWLESAPNTEPSTQPSSPNWSKKRKLTDYQHDHRNGFMPSTTRAMAGRRQNAAHVKMESRTHQSLPITPVTNSKPQTPSYPEHDEDAEAEDDDDPTATNTAALPSRETSPPAPWPSSKSRPPKSNKPPPPPKHSRKRKKSESTTPLPKRSAMKSARQPSSRVPLSQEQKKANHTSSEQRRRDATARGYAELYDLVPEVAALGKQSTMKKLEVVVDKVTNTIAAVADLRAKLGLQPGGSIADLAAAQGLDPEALAMLAAAGHGDTSEDDSDNEGDDEDAEGATWDD